MAVAAIALRQVPADVSCVKVTTEGARSTTRLFDVSPGADAELVMDRLPLGKVQFSGEAYASACGQVVAGSVSSWTADPVTTSLVRGTVARVVLTMHRPAGSALVNVDFVDDDAGNAGDGGGAAGFLCDSKLVGAKWIVGVQTGATIDVASLSRDSVEFPEATLDGDWVVFPTPLGDFDFSSFPYTTSGLQSLPASLSVRTAVSRQGEVCAGVFGGTDSEALSLFTHAHNPRHDRNGCLENNNYCSFDWRADRQETVSRPKDFRVLVDLKNSGLGSEAAYRYAIARAAGFAQGGPQDFTELYEQHAWGLRSNYVDDITVGQSAIQFNCLFTTQPYTRALAAAWCPSPNQQCRVDTSRSFNIAYVNPLGTWLEAVVVNDNSCYTNVILDGGTVVTEGPGGSYWSQHHLFDAFTTQVRLEVNQPWSGSYAFVRFAVLGGSVSFSNVQEAAGGVINPVSSPDQNPPPQTFVVNPGWNIALPASP